MSDAAIGSGSTPKWTIKALDTGTSTVEGSILTYLRNCGRAVQIPRVMWLLEGPSTIVVDTSVAVDGCPNEFVGEQFSRNVGQVPSNALKAAGVSPSDVEFVILTHLHWDHAGNCNLFPEARIAVQEEELRYAVAPGRFFRRAYLSPQSGWPVPPFMVPNLMSVTGEAQILPGVRVVPAPGHTPGSQAVLVDCEKGIYCIAGDAMMVYENLLEDTPPGFHVDVDRSLDSLDDLRARATKLLPSHDYSIFSDRPVTQVV